MGAIVIQADSESKKILSALAKRLGAQVTLIDEDQYEELLLGTLMDEEKTGKTVSRDSIFKKLKGK